MLTPHRIKGDLRRKNRLFWIFSKYNLRYQNKILWVSDDLLEQNWTWKVPSKVKNKHNYSKNPFGMHKNPSILFQKKKRWNAPIWDFIWGKREIAKFQVLCKVIWMWPDVPIMFSKLFWMFASSFLIIFTYPSHYLCPISTHKLYKCFEKCVILAIFGHKSRIKWTS